MAQAGKWYTHIRDGVSKRVLCCTFVDWENADDRSALLCDESGSLLLLKDLDVLVELPNCTGWDWEEPMKKFIVHINQVNQTYVVVEAIDREDAREKGYAKWREDYAHSSIMSVEECGIDDRLA